MQLGMRKLCCACHSSSIAALIHIMIVPDMHGQRHCEIKASRLRLPRTEAFFLRFIYSNFGGAIVIMYFAIARVSGA